MANVPAGSTWRRLYESRYPDPLGYGPGLSRFSDPTGKAFGLVYLGSSAKVAFVETILRDSAIDGATTASSIWLKSKNGRLRRSSQSSTCV